METKLTDFAVIGLGGMGSAALYHLSLTGARVTGFDQFDPPHDLGSSHGQTRIYRKLGKLILETEKYSGINFFFRRPCLSVGADKPGTVFSGALESAKIYNLKHRVADAVSIKNDFPFIRLPKHYKACIDPEAGIMIPEECIRAHLKLAEANAAVVHRQTLIQEINDTGNGFEIIANNIKYNARTLIVTAGAWTSKILPRLPVKLTVTREVMTFLETDKSLHSVKGLPSVIMSEDNGDEFYGIFALDGTHFKGGNHSFNPKKQGRP
ncbi:hypothetical protein CHS0354_030070 [Potamilus streckersoni]|uniref:FAD dependent oxidoreductase domain-containing protein n=1 Tax=Potamilus streckersoni TaxID=2493646 RepID=A0AAE0RL15_9BIVA|nr:hypothetical protein CHS0354_030070 [Potamilus streckersoni]